MGPEVLIVGDAVRRADLLARIEGLGYQVSTGTELALGERMTQRQIPEAVVVCTEDVDPRALMAELRGTRRGSGVPVTLYGPLGGRIDDLADVLDLGADHFLEEPADDDQLAAAMEELVGPGAPRSAPPRPPAALSEGSPTVEDPPDDGASGETTGEGSTSVVLGQLHRTLDMLEERLREREESDTDDELDLEELGFTELPDTGEGPAARPSSSGGSSLELSLSPAGIDHAGGSGRREPTERLSRDAPPRASDATAPVDPAVVGPATRSPLPIDSQGAIEEIEVPRLLWILHRAGYTGALRIEHGEIHKRVWWNAGDIVFASSSMTDDRLIDGVLRRGLLTRYQYEAAQRFAVGEPHRVGARLVEAGLLKADELTRVVRDHLVHIIDGCFPWTSGRWALEPNERCEESVLGELSVALIVAQGVRHRMESAQLGALLGGLERYPRVRELATVAAAAEGTPALAERLGMSPSEDAWLSRFDGSQSLRTLVEHPATDEQELLALTYMLHVLNYVELSDDAGAHANDADPAAIDAARVRDRLQRAREADYFALLGVPRDSERLDVRRAHAALHQTFAEAHLEVSVRESLARELEELRALLDEARDVLMDDSLRSAYLAHLEEP